MHILFVQGTFRIFLASFLLSIRAESNYIMSIFQLFQYIIIVTHDKHNMDILKVHIKCVVQRSFESKQWSILNARTSDFILESYNSGLDIRLLEYPATEIKKK